MCSSDLAGPPTALPTPPTGVVGALSLGGPGGGYSSGSRTLSVVALATRAWSAADAAAFAAAPKALALAAKPPVVTGRALRLGRLSASRPVRRSS